MDMKENYFLKLDCWNVRNLEMFMSNVCSIGSYSVKFNTDIVHNFHLIMLSLVLVIMFDVGATQTKRTHFTSWSCSLH